MDINGAKALKKRLGPNGAEEAPPVAVDVPEDAPPIYQWLGVSHPGRESSHADDEPTDASVSLFRRLGLSLR